MANKKLEDSGALNIASTSSEIKTDYTLPVSDTRGIRGGGKMPLSQKSVKDSTDPCSRKAELFPESHNVQSTIEKCIDEKIDNSNESLVDRLRGIKRKRSPRSEGTTLRFRDAEISIDEFAKSARILDRACDSARPVGTRCNPPTRLGLVPFVLLKTSSSLQEENFPGNNESATHLSFDEDNEEDMFAEAKDDLEDVEEFGNWDCTKGETSASFHGFTSRASEYSKNIAEQYEKREKLEKLRSYQEEDLLRGFSTVDIDGSVEIAEMWNHLLKKYYQDSGIEIRSEKRDCDRTSVEKGTGSLPRSGELRNIEFTMDSDKKLTIPARESIEKARTPPSESIERIDERLPNNCKINDFSEPSSLKFAYPQDFRGFTTASGCKVVASEAAILRAQKMYKEVELLEQEKEIIVTTRTHSTGDVENDIVGKSRAISGGEMKNEIIVKTTNDSDREIRNKIGLGFTTARGGKLKISKEALSKAQAQFAEIKDEIIENLIEPEPQISTIEIKKDPNFSFTTTGGCELTIPKEALSKAQAQFNEIEDEIIENLIEPSPQITTKEVKNEISFGFATAGGRELTIPKEALSKAQAQFNEIEDEIIENLIEPSPQITTKEVKNEMSFGFATAGGRELKISKKALSKAKAQLNDIEMEFGKDLSEINPKINTLVANVSYAKNSAATTSTVSRKIIDRPTIVAAGTPLGEENLAIDSCNFESLEFEDFLVKEPLKKRKFDEIDDDTPMRREPPWKRKKGRYVSDLQGRKLFVEDSASESEVDTTIEPQKMHISDEVNASAAALMEDEERSQEITKLHSRTSHDVKVETKSENVGKSQKNLEEVIEPQRKNKDSNRSPSTLGSSSKIQETFGEKKNLEIQPESIPDDLTFDSQFSQELHDTQVISKFIMETMKIMEARLAMSSKQDEAIRSKRRTKPQACDGSLYQLRISKRDSRISWQELAEGEAPIPRENSDQSTDSEVLSVTANSAASYSFCCADFYGGKNVRINVEGIKVGDDAFLILDERNSCGVREFERAFLASPGVDPNLILNGWVKNHYRWIVWKLASMDRVKFGHKCLPRMLTPNRVMLELKYRYDREIYRSQWPPLRRILEKNEDAAARLVLCVASIIVEDDNKTPVGGSSSTPSAFGSTMYKVKLTDGWYCIAASIDLAMVNCIKSGKIREGTKLVTFGAKAMNLDQGCSVLEIPEAVTLRIHTNSTRRARWNTKMDFCHPNRGPMSLSLKSVKSNGGAICKMIVAVARLYPILYREKLPDGQFVYRNARCDEEAARAHEARYQSKIEEIYENARNDFHIGSQSQTENRAMAREDEIRQEIALKLRECLPPPRDVTPVLKIRIAEGETSAMMTIWSTDRETDQVFVEGSSVVIYNCFASGQRCNELQITAGRNTVFNPEVSRRIAHPERIFTSLMDIGEPGFNPVYGEFDTVGVVSSIGPAPHGMKNFETVNLACPRHGDEEASDFLSVLFWQGVSTHGYSKILTVGALVACSNLEWRRNTSRSIPTAYCTERSVFTKNPRQKHLGKPFESLRERIKDPFAYAAACSAAINEEIARKTSLRTPGNGTPYKGTTTSNPTPGWSPRDLAGSIDNNCTPRNYSRKASIMKRIERLEVYGEPPKLPSIVINHSSPRVLSDFRSPLIAPPVTKS